MTHTSHRFKEVSAPLVNSRYLSIFLDIQLFVVHSTGNVIILCTHTHITTAPQLIREGKIQILGQTLNSVVYAVASDSKTGLAKDNPSVLKGGTVWYEDREELEPGKGIEESDKKARKEATIYEALGQHDHILRYLGLETATVSRTETAPKAQAIRLERAPHGGLRDFLLETATNPSKEQTRLELAVQFSEGVAHIHNCSIIWGDLSIPNALLFDKLRLKLWKFAEPDLMDNYPMTGMDVRINTVYIGLRGFNFMILILCIARYLLSALYHSFMLLPLLPFIMICSLESHKKILLRITTASENNGAFKNARWIEFTVPGLE